MLTAPIYFKFRADGLQEGLANTSDYDDIYAPTVTVFKKATLASNPKLAESVIRRKRRRLSGSTTTRRSP